MKKSVIALTAIACFAATSVCAAKTLVLTLNDVVYLALRHNPDVEQADLQRIVDKYAVTVAENQFQPKYKFDTNYSIGDSSSGGSYSSTQTFGANPEANIETHYGTQLSVQANNDMTNGSYNPGVTFNITQPLIKGFGKPIVMAALENAYDSEHVNKLKFRQLAMDTIKNALEDYFALLQAYESMAVSKQSYQQNLETVKNDKLMIKAGRMAGSDIVEAQSQVAQDLSSIETQKAAIQQAKTNLLENLGLSVNTQITIPQNFDFNKTLKYIVGDAKIPSRQKSVDMALENNTSYQAAVISINNLVRNLMVAKNNSDWDLEFKASATRGGGGGSTSGIENLTNNQNYAESAGLTLSIPIDNVNNKQAVIQAEVALEQAKIGLLESKRSLIENIRTDYDNLQTNYRQLQLSRQALYLQRRTYWIKQQKFLAGKLSNFELLTVQQNLATDENQVISDEITYLNSIESFQNDIGSALTPWHVRVRY